MRARWLKPEFFTDKKIAAIGPAGALVFAALWCMADDGGTAPCDSDTVKAQLFYRWGDIGVPEITKALQLLDDTGRITRYSVGDDEYACIVNWSKHQKVHKPSSFRYPSQVPDDEVPGECGTSAAPLPASPPPRHLDSQTPRHSNTQSPRRAATGKTGSDPAFEALWKCYPKRAGGNPKQRACRAFAARIASGVALAELTAGLDRYTAFVRAAGKEGTEFVLQAATFFGPDERWKEPWDMPASASSRPSSTRADETGAETAWEDLLAQLPIWQRREWGAEQHAKLSPAAKRAYAAINGFLAIQNATIEKRGLVKHQFLRAYRNASLDKTAEAGQNDTAVNDVLAGTS